MFTSKVRAWLCATVVFLATLPASETLAQDTLSKGHRVLLNRGLQIQAVTVPEYNSGYFSMRDFRLANFTSINMGHAGSYHPDWYGPPGSYKFGAVLAQPHITEDAARARAPDLVSLQYRDEQYLSNPAVRADTKAWFDRVRNDPLYANTILYTNQYGTQIPEQDLRIYMAESKPDMVMMDEYVIGSGNPYFHSNGSPTMLYQTMMKYRNLALAGHDGTGRNPIPFAKYIQSFSVNVHVNPESVRKDYRLSESEIRLDQFSSWAMGFTFLAAFTFDSMEPAYAPFGALLFTGEGRRVRRTTEFRYFADTNRQSRNLGPTLVRLKSTDIRILNGPLSQRHHNIPEWNPGADVDPYMLSLTADNPGTVLGGERGDVMVGFFEPLPGLGSGDSAHDRYFMILNGLTGEGASATDAAQLIRMDFDFGASGINSLQRVSRETGLIEDIALAFDGGSRYHLELMIPGGTGDLFRYHRGGLAAVPEPGALSLVLVAGVFALRRRRTPTPTLPRSTGGGRMMPDLSSGLS